MMESPPGADVLVEQSAHCDCCARGQAPTRSRMSLGDLFVTDSGQVFEAQVDGSLRRFDYDAAGTA